MNWRQQLEILRQNLLALGARRLAALAGLVAATMLVVGAVGYYASRAETEALYVGLSAADVGRMGAALQAAGIPFDVSADGTRILVRRVQAPGARMLLAEKGLPSGATAGYELFDKLGPLGLTSFMQEVTRTRALEGELARTIQTMKGVKSARVHVVYPDNSSFRRNRQPASASVVVRMEGLREPTAALVIRHLVAAAVPGLSPEQVSVMTTDGAVLAASGDASGAASAKIIELERNVSSQLQDNVRRTLAPYLGIENFEVSVAARLNTDRRQLNEQMFDPEAKAERSTRVVRESGSTQGAGSRQGGVSVEQNVPGETPAASTGEPSRKSNDRREELTNFEINTKTIATLSEGHRIDTINVAVVLNRKRLVASLGPAAGDASALESRIKEIERVVSAAAGLNATRGDRISIAAFDFADVPGESAGKLALVDAVMLHLDRVIIAITALAAIAMLVWLGMLPAVRTIVQAASGRTGEALSAAQAAAIESAGEPRQIADGQPAAARLPAPAANPTQQKLAELVERDGKQVAMILKQWMAKS